MGLDTTSVKFKKATSVGKAMYISAREAGLEIDSNTLAIVSVLLMKRPDEDIDMLADIAKEYLDAYDTCDRTSKKLVDVLNEMDLAA